MVAVAVAALAMGGFIGSRAVWQYFVALDRVRFHEGMEAMWRWLDPLGTDQSQAMDQSMDLIEEEPRIIDDDGLYDDMIAAFREYQSIVASFHRSMDYHAAMARKYRHVAVFPWLAIEPDPPEPVP
jgi:hypothetical protein